MTGPAAGRSRDALLEVKGLTVSFDSDVGLVRAVEDVSFEVEENTVCGLVGESGCGKSTLAHALVGLVPPPGRVVSGELRLRGRPYSWRDTGEWRTLRGTGIGMVFQGAMSGFNPVLTIGKQVQHILGAHPEVFPSLREGRAYFEELLGLVQLPARIWGNYESELSGGMKQRVAIVTALLLKPSVLVLDEPTTALDLLNQRLVMDLLRDLHERLGLTIMFVTHDLAVVADLADRAVVMYAGRLVESGRTEEIFGQGRKHPYVAALVEAVPSVLSGGLDIRPVPGEVPNLAHPPPGCRFAPRCGLAEPLCSHEEPPLQSDVNGHAVACHVVNRRVGPPGQPPVPAGPGVAQRPPCPPLVRPAPRDAATPAARAASFLEVDSVSHWYTAAQGSPPALREVSLSVAPNEVVAVVGESGCGKTTLGKLVAGLYRPAAGDIRFDGEAVWSLKGRDQKRYRRAVQLIHQDPYASLNPGVTIGDTIAPALVRHGLARRRDANSAVVRSLSAVGLDASREFLERYPHQLSGGQRQRVAIARAISLEPSLVVADEATSMLDVSVQVAVLDLLLSLRDGRDLAYLFISHNFGVVRYFARSGRTLVMLHGAILEEGPTEELIARPLHPYTALLLQSVPVPDPVVNRERRRRQLPLVLTSAVPSRGCIYASRCPFVKDDCRARRPPYTEVAGGHKVRCLFPGVASSQQGPPSRRPASSAGAPSSPLVPLR